MMLEEISAYLDSTYTSPVVPELTEGLNLFLSRIQDSPDFCVALYESTFGDGQYTLDGGKRVYEEMNLQVIVRDAEYNYLSARQFAERVMNLLDAVNGQSLGGTRYIRIKARGAPMPLTSDARNRIMISTNFHVVKDLSSVSSP